MTMPGLIIIGLPAAGVPFEQEDLDIVKDLTPVDTGYMQSRWTIESDGFAIVNDTDYAAYVEFGHHTRSGSTVEGQHFAYEALLRLYTVISERHPELDDYTPMPGEMEIFVGY